MSFTFCRRELGLTADGFHSAAPPNFVPRCSIVIQLDEAEADAARKAEDDGAHPRWKAGFYLAEIFPQTAEERINNKQHEALDSV